MNLSEENLLHEGVFEILISYLKSRRVKSELRKEVASRLAQLSVDFAKNPGGAAVDAFRDDIEKIVKKYSLKINPSIIYRIIQSVQNKHRTQKNTKTVTTTFPRMVPHPMKLESLISFKKFIGRDEEEYLDERLIQLNNGAKYNQIVIAAGGAGSGKGFALKNFVDSFSYKVRDVDEWKRLFLKINRVKGKYPEIAGLNLKNPKDVARLHAFVDEKGIKDKTLQLLARNIPKDSKHKPNLYFDITGKSAKSIQEIVNYATLLGYEPKNIHLLWILTDYKVAFDNNLGRDRVVPEDIFLETHSGAAKTMFDIIGGQALPNGLNGAVWVILNNKENTVYWRHGDGKLKGQPEFFGDNKAKDLAYNTKGNLTVKSFMRIQAKKAGKPFGMGVLDWKKQLYNWIIANIPRSGTSELIMRIFNRIKAKSR